MARELVDCAICGKPQPIEKTWRSKFTGARFCDDVVSCARRRARQRRREAKERKAAA